MCSFETRSTLRALKFVLFGPIPEKLLNELESIEDFGVEFYISAEITEVVIELLNN